MKTTLLIDADIVAYVAASKGQTKINWGDDITSTTVRPLEEMTDSCADIMDHWMKKLKADDMVVCLSAPSDDGWRKDVLPSYKANRDGVEKPQMLLDVKQWMRETYRVFERPRLEADDVMGILSTSSTIIKGRKIIVSIDKDMKTIPGWLWNPDKDAEPWLVSQADADYWHFYQTLVGDSTDGYKGCPGIGPKGAEAWLTGSALGPCWLAVAAAFRSKGLTEEDALVQARVSRICRNTDYDFKRKEVILWNPPPPN